MAQLIISERLRDRLGEMSDSCPIAETILVLSACDHPLYRDDGEGINFLDVATEETYVSYVRNVHLTAYGDAALTKPGCRARTTPGKLVGKLFAKKAGWSSADIEQFHNLYTGLATVKINATRTIVVSGKEIRKYYNGDMYATGGGGTLGKSCMRYDKCQEWFSIYEHNDVCSMIVMLSSEKVIGRAILWEFIYNDKPLKLMDRIYYSEDSIVPLFKKWAEENGYLCKPRQDNETPVPFVSPTNGERLTDPLISIPLKVWDFNYYPYMDTFCRLYMATGMLSTDDRISDDRIILRNHSDGRWGGVKFKTCQLSGKRIDPNAGLMIDGIGFVCKSLCIKTVVGTPTGARELYVLKNPDVQYEELYLKGRGVVLVNPKDLVYSNYHKGPILRGSATYSKYHKSWILTRNSVSVDGVGIVCVDETVITYDGRLMLLKETAPIVSGRYATQHAALDELTALKDGTYVLTKEMVHIPYYKTSVHPSHLIAVAGSFAFSPGKRDLYITKAEPKSVEELNAF